MVYLIGCDHQNAQAYRKSSSLADPENLGQAQLRELIRATVARHQPQLIGEETNAEILCRKGTCSVAFDAALECGITHRFCEPTWNERNELSIGEDLPFLGPSHPPDWKTLAPSEDSAHRHDIGHRWPIREEFWIDSLGKALDHDLLFICGDAHRWTFRRRLEAKGIKVRLIEKRVGAKTSSQKFFEAYRDVRRKGFPPPTGCFCVSPHQQFDVKVTSSTTD